MDNREIIPLKGADRVRKRPAVIFESSDVNGALMAIANLVDNSSREAREGFGKTITIRRFADNSFEIEDQGRGIPVEYNEEEKMYNWQLNFCELYAASRYPDENDLLNNFGLGLCSVQYVSEYMDAVIYREDKKYMLHFENGENVGGLRTEINTEKRQGTYLKFRLDETVFDDTHIEYENLKKMVEHFAVTNTGISYNFEFNDADVCKKETYLYENLSARIYDCFPDEKVIAFEDKCEFEGLQRERKCFGSVAVCLAYTKNKKIEEVYHHERFLERGGIAIQVIKNVLNEKITQAFKGKEILDGISIIVHSKLYPKRLVSWTDGRRNAIENSIIGEYAQVVAMGLADKLIEAIKTK